MTVLDQMSWDFGDYDCAELADTVNYILKDIGICHIKEQCSYQEESK
jgi:hypothetical protein